MCAVAVDPNKYKVIDDQRAFTSNRVKSYFQDQTSEEFLQNTVAPVVKGTFIGAALGLVAGAYTGAQTGAVMGTCVGGPAGTAAGTVAGAAAGGGAGMAKGALLGASIGLAGGCVWSAYCNYAAYNEWLKLYKETAVFKEFEDLHQNHPSLQQFIDPVMHCLILDPVRDPFNRLYDRSTLIALSRQNNNGLIPDPFRNGTYSLAQITDAPEMLAELKRNYITLLEGELNANITPEVRQGLQDLIEDLRKQITNYITRETHKLTHQLQSGQITPIQFQAKMAHAINLA